MKKTLLSSLVALTLLSGCAIKKDCSNPKYLYKEGEFENKIENQSNLPSIPLESEFTLDILLQNIELNYDWLGQQYVLYTGPKRDRKRIYKKLVEAFPSSFVLENKFYPCGEKNIFTMNKIFYDTLDNFVEQKNK